MSKRVARSVWIPAPSGYSLSLKEYSDEFSLLTQRPKMLINCAGVTCEDLIPERYQEQRRLRIRSLVDMTISEFEMVEVWVVLGEEVPVYSQFRLHVSPCSMLIEVKSVPVPRFEPGTEFVAQNIKLTRGSYCVRVTSCLCSVLICGYSGRQCCPRAVKSYLSRVCARRRDG